MYVLSHTWSKHLLLSLHQKSTKQLLLQFSITEYGPKHLPPAPHLLTSLNCFCAVPLHIKLTVNVQLWSIRLWVSLVHLERKTEPLLVGQFTIVAEGAVPLCPYACVV